MAARTASVDEHAAGVDSTALAATRRWGRASLVGEGGRLEIHEAAAAYATADAGTAGKVAPVMA